MPSAEKASAKDPHDVLKSYMEKHGLKASRQRDIIAETFFSAGGHLTVDDLLERVRAQDARVSQATVYRTMRLLADCGHIAAASGVALLVEAARLPLSPALERLFPGDFARKCALSGGDDYRLAFTLPAAELAAVKVQWPEVTVIGRVEAGQGVHLLDAAGAELQPPALGYQHFGSQGD